MSVSLLQEAVAAFLSRNKYFQRYGGADHFMTSLYWNDRGVLKDLSPLMSFRGVLATFEPESVYSFG